jgi:hypothetical protein
VLGRHELLGFPFGAHRLPRVSTVKTEEEPR